MLDISFNALLIMSLSCFDAAGPNILLVILSCLPLDKAESGAFIRLSRDRVWWCAVDYAFICVILWIMFTTNVHY